MNSRTHFGFPSGDGGKIVMAGMACDFASSGLLGCRKAPQTLLHLTKSIRLACFETCPDLIVSDVGVLKYQQGIRIDNYFKGIEVLASQITSKSKLLFSIGGDHVVSLPLIKGVANSIGSIQVLHIDAHYDCNPIDENSSPSHSNFVQYLCQLPNVDRWIAIGQRKFSLPAKNLPDKFVMSDIDSFADQLDRNLPLYVSVDLDALDSSVFPAVSFPEPGPGYSWGQLLSIFDRLHAAGIRVIGIDISEYNPELDMKNHVYGSQLVYFLGRLLEKLAGMHL